MGLLGKTLSAGCESEDVRARTLTWVNRQRLTYRRDELNNLPKGVPNTTIKCPVSLAFEDIFGVGLVMASPAYLRYASDQRIISRLPKYVTIFVAIFDDRGYPDLVQDEPDPSLNPHFLYVPESWIENYYALGRCA